MKKSRSAFNSHCGFCRKLFTALISYKKIFYNFSNQINPMSASVDNI